MFAHHTWTRTYVQDLTVPDIDTPSFSAELLTSGGILISPPPIWISVDTSVFDRVKVTLNGPPNTEVGTYQLRLRIWDQFNTLTPRTYSHNIVVVQNKSPYKTVMTASTQQRIPFPFNYTFMNTIFTDDEGDAININCNSIVTNPLGIATAWLSFTFNLGTGVAKLEGNVPADNDYAVDYIFTCEIDDPYTAPPNYYQITLTYLPKQQTVIDIPVPSQSTRVNKNHAGHEIDLSGRYHDLEVQ